MKYEVNVLTIDPVKVGFFALNTIYLPMVVR